MGAANGSEKPSVQIMRQKMISLTNKRKSSARNSKQKYATKIFENEKDDKSEKKSKFDDEYEPEIAQEASPIWEQPQLIVRRQAGFASVGRRSLK